MIKIALSDVANAIGCDTNGSAVNVTDIVIDTRKVSEGSIFVALIGENHDAHNFIEQILDRRPAAIVASRSVDTGSVPLLIVKDTRVALGQIASFVRSRLSGPCIGITGSAGKTTVKEMVYSILSKERAGIVTQGNFNNEIGVPLTLFQLEPEDAFAVIEMGAAKLGDIAYLSEIARPDITLVNNVLPAHIEGFGSIENVAVTKGEIYRCLPENGTAVVNVDLPFSKQFAEYAREAGANIITTSTRANQQSDFWVEDVSIQGGHGCFVMCTPNGAVDIELKILGEHNISNALNAAAMAFIAGASLASIESGLQSFVPVSGRMNEIRCANGALLIDDSYNANPGSVKKAIDAISLLQGHKIIVLGNMAELGSDEIGMHRDIGKYLNSSNVDEIITLGDLAKHISDNTLVATQHCDSISACADIINNKLDKNTVVLIKGSRSAGLDRLVDNLINKGSG